MKGIIRLATPDDAAAVRDIYGPVCTDTAISFELEPPSVAEMRGRIERIGSAFPWLVMERGGEVAGYVYAGLHRERAAYRWSTDVTAYVHPHHHRAGVGSTLYRSLFRLLVLQGYFKAFAGVTLPNPASVGLHEALGFRPLGVYHGVGYKFGVWHDVGWWELALQPEVIDPPEPRRMADLLADPRFAAALRADR